MKIVVIHDDGTQADITDGVQTLYDNVLGSLDWQSGFFDLDEQEQVARVGEACRFEAYEEILKNIERDRVREEKQRAQAAREAEARAARREAAKIADHEQWARVARVLMALPPAPSGLIVVKE